MKREGVGAEVTSDNIVGYKKIHLPANDMAILANCFVPNNASIQDLVAGGDFNPEGGDWIRLYDPESGKYTLASWWGSDYGIYAGPSEDDPLIADSGWGDGYQTVVDYSLEAGQGFWAQSVEGGFIRMAGNVATSGEVQIPANDMTLVGNPFPVATDIQTIVASAEFSPEGGDWIRIYDPESGRYTLASWWGDGYGVYAGPNEDDPLVADYGWGDGYQTIINATVPAGFGFWCQSVNGGTLTFQNPIAE